MARKKADKDKETPVGKLMQKKLGKGFENPEIPDAMQKKCEEFRGIRLDRQALQTQEQELEAEILEFMQKSKDKDIKKRGFVVELPTEVVHFRIDDDPVVKTRRLEKRDE